MQSFLKATHAIILQSTSSIAAACDHDTPGATATFYVPSPQLNVFNQSLQNARQRATLGMAEGQSGVFVVPHPWRHKFLYHELNVGDVILSVNGGDARSRHEPPAPWPRQRVGAARASGRMAAAAPAKPEAARRLVWYTMVVPR